MAALLALSACHRRKHPASESAPSPVPTTTPAAQEAPAPASPGACGVSCCGGYACGVTALNAGRAGCVPGATTCNACPSGLACVPGDCNTMLAAGETWALHVSYISGGGVPDMCASARRNAWVCLLRSGLANGNWSCLPMSQACDSGVGRGVAAVSVTTADLTVSGIDLQIRDGSPTGAVMAERQGARYTTGIARQALCSGLKFDKLRDLSGSGISIFAYFLEP